MPSANYVSEQIVHFFGYEGSKGRIAVYEASLGVCAVHERKVLVMLGHKCTLPSRRRTGRQTTIRAQLSGIGPLRLELMISWGMWKS